MKHIRKQYNNDVEIVQCGYQKCYGGHFFGPAVRDFYLLHYVIKGRGIFELSGKSHNVETGGGFLICPNVLTYYEADIIDPWEYIWVGFTGEKAKELLSKSGLTENTPTFSDLGVDEHFRRMKSADEMRESEIVILASLYNFFVHMFQSSDYEDEYNKNIKQEYVTQAIQYIKNNYANDINVTKISSEIGLNRSYFFEIFKQNTGLSPQQFLISYRMERACSLLSNTNLRVSDVARSVGYSDEFTFSRVFTNKIGVSPSKYKRQ